MVLLTGSYVLSQIAECHNPAIHAYGIILIERGSSVVYRLGLSRDVLIMSQFFVISGLGGCRLSIWCVCNTPLVSYALYITQ